MDKQQEKVAKLLWRAGCITIKTRPTFRWASGLVSPIYTDNRLLLSHPKERRQIIECFVEAIKKHARGVQVIAGVATSGIPLAAMIADHMNKPMIYVRPKPKAHGRGQQIEGGSPKGKKVILIEDLVSTGGSSIAAAQALRKAGAKITDVMATFAYLPDLAGKAFAKKKFQLRVLSDAEALLKTGYKAKSINAKHEESTRKFLEKLSQNLISSPT